MTLGVPYIEAGNPGSNPKDLEFFRRAGELKLKHARLVAFGSTRRKGISGGGGRQRPGPADGRIPVRWPSLANAGICTSGIS